MPNIIIDFIPITGSYTGTQNNSGFLQAGDNANGNAESQGMINVQPYGFYSLPPNAIAGQTAAEGCRIKGVGNRDICIGIRHLGSNQLAGNYGSGETVIVGGGPDGTSAGRFKVSADSSCTMMTTSTGKNTDPSDVYYEVASDGFRWVAPWGTMIFDASGFHIQTLAGARFDMGAMNGLPGPLASLSSFICCSAGNFAADCPTVDLGPSAGVSFPAAIPSAPTAIAGVPLPPFATTVSSCVTIKL